jgi:hypothetical protein
LCGGLGACESRPRRSLETFTYYLLLITYYHKWKQIYLW